MEDRSSINGDDRFPVTLAGVAGKAGGEVRLTELAAKFRGKSQTLEWLVRQVGLLGLPGHEFRCTVGLKVLRDERRGDARAVAASARACRSRSRS